MTKKADQVGYSAVSLFSGCGGMDLGFRGGFDFLGKRFERLPLEIVWANDISSAACNTYKANLGTEITEGDVWESLELLPESADLVIGGFPCQDISINNGKAVGISGKRSGLYRAMVAAVERLRPAVFVAENVKSLLHKNHKDSLKRVLRDFSSAGYNVKIQLIQTADYGVPQTRERVFIVGTAPGIPEFDFPAPTHIQEDYITAFEALKDLEKLSENKAINHIWSKAKSSPEQGSRRLKKDRAGYTVRAECHGNIHFHYSKKRRMSMREAARIQSFPDDFLFTGGIREIERQVGNAVPPVFAWHLASQIVKLLESRIAVDSSEHAEKLCA
jgi:DNA (cytosine-5)-methyltransferase 1